jgi:hypothetical protein
MLTGSLEDHGALAGSLGADQEIVLPRMLPTDDAVDERLLLTSDMIAIWRMYRREFQCRILWIISGTSDGKGRTELT